MLQLSCMTGAFLAATMVAANATCPQERAVYEAANGNLLEFTGNSDASARFHQIGILLQREDAAAKPIILEAFVESPDGVARPEMTIQRNCPSGDFTAEDLEACTLYQSAVYATDDDGVLGDLPIAGQPAADAIVLPNFRKTAFHPVWETEAGRGPKEAAEIYQLAGCLE